MESNRLSSSEEKMWAAKKERERRRRDSWYEIREGEYETRAVSEEELVIYSKIGLETGFEVEVIALEGEDYPHRNVEFQVVSQNGKEGIDAVSTVKYAAVPKGKLAICIKNPNRREENWAAFWDSVHEYQTSKLPKGINLVWPDRKVLRDINPNPSKAKRR